MNPTIRKPCVAGHFYPSNEKRLREDISQSYHNILSELTDSKVSGTLIGAIVPHAGYMFSGNHAVHFFARLALEDTLPETVVIFNPNHTGMGTTQSTDINEAWATPLGVTHIDHELGVAMGITKSAGLHSGEHSSEVMLPFLQYFLPAGFKILPITISQQNAETSKKLALDLYTAVVYTNRRIVVVASSDFSHYVSPDTGFRDDQLVIDEILNLDSTKVEQVVRSRNISVCGFGPIMTLMEYSKLVSGHPFMEIYSRGHSGETLQSKSVVDYVCMGFRKG